jgi:hypothetical protein
MASLPLPIKPLIQSDVVLNSWLHLILTISQMTLRIKFLTHNSGEHIKSQHLDNIPALEMKELKVCEWLAQCHPCWVRNSRSRIQIQFCLGSKPGSVITTILYYFRGLRFPKEYLSFSFWIFLSYTTSQSIFYRSANAFLHFYFSSHIHIYIFSVKVSTFLQLHFLSFQEDRWYYVL